MRFVEEWCFTFVFLYCCRLASMFWCWTSERRLSWVGVLGIIRGHLRVFLMDLGLVDIGGSALDGPRNRMAGVKLAVEGGGCSRGICL